MKAKYKAVVFDLDGKLVYLIYAEEQLKQKLKYFTEFITLTKVEPAECLIVGDGENDVILFQETGGGLTVGDAVAKELRSLASGHIDNLIQIKDYL